MKATGIVRRIDDLGRIVVPKEIRRTLRIREGDPLEIFTDREGEIILKKYSPIGELSQFAGEYAESLAQTTGHLVLITDCDHVVTASGTGKKEYDLRKMLSILPQFQEIINNPSLASKVHADTGGYGVSWSDDLDLDSETIWEDGVFIRIESVDPSLALASSLARAREYAMLTQKQLSEKTGIYQSDISKLERGNANPSILTLKRLADAMDMTLKIEFVPKK
jgi:stage V sporulation protein T